MLIFASIKSKASIPDIIADSFEAGYWYLVLFFLLMDVLIIYLLFHKKINKFIAEYRENKEANDPYLPIWGEDGKLIGVETKKMILKLDPETNEAQWRYKKNGKLVKEQIDYVPPEGMKESAKVTDFKRRVLEELEKRE